MPSERSVVKHVMDVAVDAVTSRDTKPQHKKAFAR